MALKKDRHPGIFVHEAPDREGIAPFNTEAGLQRPLVVVRLLLQLCGGWIGADGQVHPDIDFGYGGFQSEIIETLKVGFQSRREAVSHAQVALHRKSVDGNALGKILLYDLIIGVAFGVVGLDAVVIEEQLGFRICLVGPTECIGDDSGAELAYPDILFSA